MAPRFDASRRTLELAVADLLETELLRSLGFANRGGYERLWLGQAIHSRYQEEALGADPSYRREVAIRHTFEHRGYEVTVQGRIDGLRRDPDGVRVVEEIKSVRRGGQLSPTALQIYERQALLYAWLLARAEGEPVRAELVLIEIGSDNVERHTLETRADLLDTAVGRRLNAILHAFESEHLASLERQAAAERLRFPYPDPRPGQERILEAVERALENRDHVLLEAPTGIGKTVAALFPALRYALAHDKRVFVLTSRTLQQEMAMAVLALLNDGGFHAVRLRAKAKMCANDEVLCHEEYCPFAKEFFLKMRTSGVVERLLATEPTLLPERIYAGAREAEVCPFEVSLELGRRSQVVVCDYNYAFDPYVALTEFNGESDLSDTILVIDEVHNLVERGRGYYSPDLSTRQALQAADRVGRGPAPIHRRIENLCLRLAMLVRETVVGVLDPAGEEKAAEAILPEDDLWALRPQFDTAFVDYLEYRRETKTLAAEDPFVGLYFDLLRFLNGLMLSDRAFSHCVEIEPDGEMRLKVLCKDPSRFLGSVISRTHATIGLSATLSPPEFYRDLLGFEPGRTDAVAIGNPFPAENRRIVIDPTVATTWRERPSNYERIARRLAAFAEAVPGNCLALFPSYGFLAEIARRIDPRGRRVLIEQRADSDAGREAILDALRSPLFGDILLLAVAGGVFAEGVDYPGEMLRAVAIVGPCLPSLSLDQRLLQAYYEERFARGFEYAFVVPGMTRVVQAAGRLLRGPEDTGVIALLDGRFLASPYRDHLPAAWVPEEGAGALAGHPAEVAESFFRVRRVIPEVE